MKLLFKKVNQYFTSRGTHLVQIVQKRFPAVNGLISNFRLFRKLNSVSLWSSEFPTLYRLLQLVEECGRAISWEELIIFLESKSELNQEFVAYLTCGSDGFFVEFGAMDGVKGSNSYLLESKFGWSGVLAEPIPELASECLRKRRSPCYNGAIVGKKNDLEDKHQLFEKEIFLDDERVTAFAKVIDDNRVGLSTLLPYVDGDLHEYTRRKGFEVLYIPSMTLQEFLFSYRAPSRINYISIDTEGSEFDILKEFPFEQYTFDFVSIEHNHSLNKDKIINLMEINGYQLVLSKFSGGDAWFVRK